MYTIQIFPSAPTKITNVVYFIYGDLGTCNFYYVLATSESYILLLPILCGFQVPAHSISAFAMSTLLIISRTHGLPSSAMKWSVIRGKNIGIYYGGVSFVIGLRPDTLMGSTRNISTPTHIARGIRRNSRN